jgi:uncharacterized protein (TIGR02466 family)
MAKLIHIFPLSIYRDRNELPPAYRAELVQLVFDMEAAAKSDKPVHSAWLGDTSGYEFLYKHERFADLYRAIAAQVRAYTEALGIDATLIDFYFQRSWATITRQGERISEHSHEQSNISVAYYLLKPADAGGINFITYNHPNEFSRGIFTPSKAALGFIKRPGLPTWNTVHLDPDEGDIVIFPSKTLHATVRNESNQPRISISADVTTMLKESTGHETMMPHFSHWRSFDD